MKIIKREFEVAGRSGEFNLDLYTDTHLGSIAVAEKRLKQDIRQTQKEGHYWAHLGDGIDGILPGDKRYKYRNLTPWAKAGLEKEGLIEAEWDMFKELFSPIQDTCLFVLNGDGKHNACLDIANCMHTTLSQMGIPHGDIMVWYIFTFKRCKGNSPVSTYNLIFHHGWFASRKDGAKVNNLKNFLGQFPEADGFFCGHGHTKTYAHLDCLRMHGEGKNQELVQWTRRAGMCGGYKRFYVTNIMDYEEIRGYDPSSIGNITLTMKPFSQDPEEHLVCKGF